MKDYEELIMSGYIVENTRKTEKNGEMQEIFTAYEKYLFDGELLGLVRLSRF
jgi:hypothetical protein